MPRLVATYNHDQKLAAMVELWADDDFTLRTPEFQSLANDLAVHVAAADPGASAHGQEVLSLLNQRFTQDTEITVRERIEQADSALRAGIRVVRYARFDARN